MRSDLGLGTCSCIGIAFAIGPSPTQYIGHGYMVYYCTASGTWMAHAGRPHRWMIWTIARAAYSFPMYLPTSHGVICVPYGSHSLCFSSRLFSYDVSPRASLRSPLLSKKKGPFSSLPTWCSPLNSDHQPGLFRGSQAALVWRRSSLMIGVPAPLL